MQSIRISASHNYSHITIYECTINRLRVIYYHARARRATYEELDNILCNSEFYACVVARDPAKDFHSERYGGDREERCHISLQCRRERVSVPHALACARARERERDPSLLSCAGRAANGRAVFPVYAGRPMLVALTIYTHETSTSFVSRFACEGGTCNIVKPQESIARGTMRGEAAERSIHRVGTERGSFVIDRSSSSSSSSSMSSCDLRARYPTIHVHFPFVQWPSFIRDGRMSSAISERFGNSRFHSIKITTTSAVKLDHTRKLLSSAELHTTSSTLTTSNRF